MAARLFALRGGHGQQGADGQAVQALEIVELLEIVQGEMDRRAGRVLGRRRCGLEHGIEIGERRIALVQRGADARQQGARLGVSGRSLDRPQHLRLGPGEISELEIDRRERHQDRQ
ncbi:MAG: hypothetical protein E6G95_06895 [Alphaproteobacteria bacterium]|nr:MAG: hypothetical protein E6G95_06895 [Alphaproteobacteria bacterium]